MTNYTDLTMVAQFNDKSILARHNADLKIAFDNGWYKVTVKQLFDPNEYYEDEINEHPSFEIIMTPATQPPQKFASSVYWLDQ